MIESKSQFWLPVYRDWLKGKIANSTETWIKNRFCIILYIFSPTKLHKVTILSWGLYPPIYIFPGVLLQLEWHKELLDLWQNGTMSKKCIANCGVRVEVHRLLQLLQTSLPFVPPIGSVSMFWII